MKKPRNEKENTNESDACNGLIDAESDLNLFWRGVCQTIYDPAGRVSSAKDANGNQTSYGYDDAGRRTTLTDALTHITTFKYDNSGNQIAVLDANQNTTQYQYDTLNRQTAALYPDLTKSTTAYDALGRVISKTDQAGKVTGYGYDALGRLTSVTQDAVTGGLNLLTQFGYDEVGNRISQRDANTHTTTYAYDQLGRRTGRTLPAGQGETYFYDAAGNLQKKIDFNGKTTTYGYDTSNRLLTKTPDPSFSAPAVTFTYTANGLRQTMSDVSGTTTYGYNNRNRLTSKQTPFGTLGYTYDNAGNLLTLTSSNANGASLAYNYDVLNRLSTVTDNRLLAQGAASGVTTYNYDPVGNLQNFTYPNGVTHAYTYDTLNRLTQMGSAKSGTAISNYVYTLGAAGNRTSVAELTGRTVAYAYDSLYRLTSETVTSDPRNNNGVATYSYDNVGNRLTLSSTLPPAGATNYTYDADDRLGSDQYDADGNTIGSGGITNTYDFENHLITHGAVTIVYDGDGNRVSETVGGVTTNYLVDTVNPTGYAQVVDELQNGSVTKTYSYGLERIDQNWQLGTGNWQLNFYGYDGHGSVRQLTNSAGAVTDSYDYDAFGNLINSTGNTSNVYLFAGEAYDSALGLYYNRARYLNTATGRFWSIDTNEGESRSPASLHKYLFAGNNPADRIDPSGHDALIDISLTAALYSGLTTMAVTTGFGVYAAVGTSLNLPKDFKTQVMKPPSAGLVGLSGTINVGRLAYDLGAAETGVGAGAVVGLQFLSFGGGYEALVPTSRDRIWFYSYYGAFYSVPFGKYNANGLGADITGITLWPGVNASFLDASLYIGAVWNLKNPEDYAGPFYCTGGSFLTALLGIRLSPNATLCSAANGVFSITSDLTGTAGSGAKSGIGSSITQYQYWGEVPRRKEGQ